MTAPIFTGVTDPKRGRLLFISGAAGLAVAAGWFGYTSPLQDPWLIALGITLMALAALPTLVWARTNARHFPVFEIFMLTGLNFYALPLLAGHTAGLSYSDEVTWQAAIGVLVFQIGALASFQAVKTRPARSPTWTESLLPEQYLRYAQTGMWLNTLYSAVFTFTPWIPQELTSVLRAAFAGLGTVCTFIVCRLWGEEKLHSAEKAAIVINLLLQVMFQSASLYLITSLSLIALAFIGYVSTSRRVPLLVLAPLVLVVGVLHNGKSTMRTLYWNADARPTPTVLELPAFYSEWFSHGLAAQREHEATNTRNTNRLLDRASLFQMLCLVVSEVPERRPFLAGETYADIAPQLVPRILWEDKPSPHESNIRLAVAFGLVDPFATESVSIAFGTIAEAWANFGIVGAAVLGVVFGAMYKQLTGWALDAPQFSALGLLTILFAAWSFQVELVLASWVSALFQAATVVVGAPMLFRRLFNA